MSVSTPRPKNSTGKQQETPTTGTALYSNLVKLGVKKGDKLLVHSALSAFGWLDGGALTVIAALKLAVGQNGLILMPSFNHGLPFSKGECGFYDPQTTPTANGLIADTFWRGKKVHRSLAPTHPFAAWGKGAQQLISGHEQTQTMGRDSPIGRLMDTGGKLLHLGTSHEVTTAMHLAETMTGAACLSAPQDFFPVHVHTSTREGLQILSLPTFRYRASACPLNENLELLTERLAPLETVAFVGNARASLSPLDRVVNKIIELLKSGTKDIPSCEQCKVGPSRFPEGTWE